MRGEFAGHFIMALATAAAATDDGKERAELRARADYVVRVLGECQQAIDDGGYLSAFPQREFEQAPEVERTHFIPLGSSVHRSVVDAT